MRMPTKCRQAGCAKQPKYGVIGTKRGEFCSEHKKDGMVDVVNKRCGYPGCTKNPSYGVAGSKKGEFCSEHKRDGMVDVVHKRCAHAGCTKKPSYGVIGTKKGEFCSEHKRDGMVNVVNKRCTHTGCTKQPSYSVAGSKKGEFCSEHKKYGMVDVVNKRCGHTGCTKYPIYGVAGSRKKELCSEHKRDGMINLSARITKSRSTSDCHGGGGQERGSSTVVCDGVASQKRKGMSFSSFHTDGSLGSYEGSSKRARQSPNDMSVDPTALELPRGKTPVSSGPNDIAVKMEEGLFEGRPSGSFESRMSRRSGER